MVPKIISYVIYNFGNFFFFSEAYAFEFLYYSRDFALLINDCGIYFPCGKNFHLATIKLASKHLL